MESDPVLRSHHSFYDMTREEQLTSLLAKARRVYEIDKEKYYHNYEISAFQWFYAMFKGIVSFSPVT